MSDKHSLDKQEIQRGAISESVTYDKQKEAENKPMSWITNLGMVLTAIVMFAAATLLFYGLAKGQG
jgi:hypothetical protein